MAVKQVSDKDGAPLYQAGKPVFHVTASKRSAVDPSIRETAERTFVGTKAHADREYEKLKDTVQRKIWEREQDGLSWGRLVDRFGYALETGEGLDRSVTKATALDTVRGLELYTQLWWKRPAKDISIVDVKRVMQEMTGQALSSSRRKAVKYYISAAWNWGKDNGLVPASGINPTTNVKTQGKKDDEDKKPDILTLAECRKLLETAKALNHPWYYAWAVALHTGCRSGELFALLWTDVDTENRIMTVSKTFNGRFKTITSTKGGYWRDVPINEELEKLLRELRTITGRTPHILPRFTDWSRGEQARILRKFCEGVGLPSIKFHALRSCFATQMLRQSVAPVTVMKICGWRDLKTMQRYVRLAGIEIEGATDQLKFLPSDAVAEIVPLFR